MASISVSELLTIIYVLVDDWYQLNGVKYLAGKAGKKPIFTNSEVITLVLAQDYIPFPSETQFIGFMRANYLELFPNLLDQSQFNRRARNLHLLIEELRRYWIMQKCYHLQSNYLLDTKPVPVLGYKRDKGHSNFAGKADYGCCVSRNLKYYGFKLVMISTLDGIPMVYDLVPANSDERVAAESVIDYLSSSNIFADKGFIGTNWQANIFVQTDNLIWTPKRCNQRVQNSKNLDRWIGKVRERIEGVFHEIQNTGRNIERLLAKTVWGLCTRVVAKMTSHLLRCILFSDFGINIQTFQATF